MDMVSPSKKNKMDMVSKDKISSLPEALICHILSFLPTKEAASTSLLSKKWRYLFALSTTLDFDDSVLYIRSVTSSGAWEKESESHRIVMDFVDRVLRLQENFTINKFSLKLRHDVAFPDCLSRWMTNVIERGVSDIDFRNFCFWNELISIVFVSKSLVRLRIESEICVLSNMKEVFLPKLKTLHLGHVEFRDTDNSSLFELVSGCPVLEELFLDSTCEKYYRNCSLSSKTLKILILRFRDRYSTPLSVSFDTPNLVYFEYSDYVADKYETVNFDSLRVARINLTSHGDMACNAIGLLVGISNVQFLCLSANTLEVLTLCSEQIPVFKNLTHLTIQTYRKLGWELLPALLKNSPNLETLVFEFEALKHDDRCTIECECQYKISGETLTFLSSSPVKFLEIRRLSDTGVEKFIEKVKQLLETMPSLEQLTMYCYTSTDDDLSKVSSQLRSQTRVASPNCEIKVIGYHLCSSFTVASSSSKKINASISNSRPRLVHAFLGQATS